MKSAHTDPQLRAARAAQMAMTERAIAEGIAERLGTDPERDPYPGLLAATEAQREQGLMHVTSLGGADGMLFRFGREQRTSFWMKDTVLPLSTCSAVKTPALVERTVG